MTSVFMFLGSVFGFLSVALGAFGAHVLKSKMSADMMDVYHTGVQYQMVHAVMIIAVALLYRWHPSGLVAAAGWCFAIGIVLFSGSLYGLSTLQINALGPVTPLGGLLFLAGWVLMAIAAFSLR